MIVHSDDNKELTGGCCAPWAKDLLVGPRVRVPSDSRCPPDHVVVGRAIGSNEVICSKIDTNLYTLTPIHPGGYWGTGYSRSASDPYLSIENAPEAIRHGIGRSGFLSWDVDGCGGVPWGAVMVGSGTESRCSDEMYAEVRFKDDRPQPVVARPCGHVVSPFFGVAQCEEGSIAAGPATDSSEKEKVVPSSTTLSAVIAEP